MPKAVVLRSPGERPDGAARLRVGAAARWLPPLMILAALAALVVGVLSDLLLAGGDRLPGRDAVMLHVWEVFTRSVLSEGRLPHWNPYQFGGTPHLADVQTTVLYPPAMLLRWLPPILFIGWMAALHVWLGGAGVLFLCRVLGVTWLPAAVAAAAVTLGGSIGGWLYNGHLLLVYGTAWLPWSLGLAVLSVRRGTLAPHPALVVVLVVQFLAGYLQGSVYIAAAVCAYYAYSLVWPEADVGAGRWRVVGQLACVALLALGLSAFQLLPTMRFVAEAGRTAGLSFEVASEGGWTFADLSKVFFPFGLLTNQPPHRYLSDHVVYVGWVLTCVAPLAFVSPRLRRMAVFFSLLAAGTVALALAESLPLYALHYELFPGLRVPGRVLFVANLSLAVLGAFGLERFVAAARGRAWRELAACGLIAALGVLAAVAALWPRDAAGDLPPMHMWPYLPVVAAAGLLLAAVLAARSAVRVALAVALAITAVDVTAYSQSAMETIPGGPASEFPGPPAEPGRAISLCENLIGTADLMLLHQPTLDGVASLHLDDYADWAYVAKTGQRPPHDGQFRRIGSDEGLFPARRDLLDSANVTAIYSCEPIDVPGVRLVETSPPLYAYANLEAWPRATWVCGAERLPRDEIVRRLVAGRYRGDRRLHRSASIRVRWAAGLSAEERRDREIRYGLSDGVRREGTTWQYAYAKGAPFDGIALVQDPAVEDTAGVDRSTGVLLDSAPAAAPDTAASDQLLVGTATCTAQGSVHVLAADRPDGYVRAEVDAPVAGVVVLSEPYYGERSATVDGRPVPALRANLAFTAVQVPAGRHDVELRMEPRSFHAGFGVSLVTLLAWAGSAARGRAAAARESTIGAVNSGAAGT